MEIKSTLMNVVGSDHMTNEHKNQKCVNPWKLVLKNNCEQMTNDHYIAIC